MDLNRNKTDFRMTARSKEKHRSGRTGWLRAAVLGANDGIRTLAFEDADVRREGADWNAFFLKLALGCGAGGSPQQPLAKLS
jgi:hypothetical protein